MRRGRIVVQKFSPCVSDGSSKAVFERAAAFYIPVVRFNSALRPGLELTGYHVVNSYHRNRQIRVFWTSKRADGIREDGFLGSDVVELLCDRNWDIVNLEECLGRSNKIVSGCVGDTVERPLFVAKERIELWQ